MALEPITGAPAPIATTRARRRQSGFALPDVAAEAVADMSAEAPAEASAAGQVPLLALQAAGMADVPGEMDSAAARHGEGMLGAMRGVQLAMLGGGDARNALARLADNMPQATDPALNAVLQAIAQRAAIERARRE